MTLETTETIKLTLAYDGSAYVGWQLQPNGMSVQQRLEEALCQLTGVFHRIHSSGRTDAGVHARGMVCHFVTERKLPLSAWREGVNRFLPNDIAVRSAEKVSADFHARFSARGKRYRYSLLLDPVRSPLDRNTCWRIQSPIDVDLMTKTAAAFVGNHDFAAFRGAGCSARTTLREVYSVNFHRQDNYLHIDISGSGFLRHMVRMMVGTLVDVGRGKRPPEVIRRMLDAPESAGPAVTAPAHGLCLINVWY